MGKVKATRFPLNVYLAKASCSSGHEAVDVAGFTYAASLNLSPDVDATLYYGRTESTPNWLAALLPIATGDIEDLKGATVSGVIVAKIGGRIFLATFGHAWQRVNTRQIEPNFGIRCVLNLAEANSLRAIRRDRVAEDSIQAIEQIPDSDEIARFGIDLEKDLLRGVKARVDESQDFGAWVAGADAFKASIDLASESLVSYLNRCYSLWSLTTYKKNFGWVDNISPLKDPSLEQQLQIAIATQLDALDPDLSLCAPDLLTWDDYDFFCFAPKKAKHSPCANHLSTKDWVNFMHGLGKTITADELAKNWIYAYRADGTMADKWPVMTCVHGTVKFNSVTYLAHSGHWYVLDDNFVARVNKRVAAIPSCALSLPTTTLTEHEGDYNVRAALASKGKLLCLDKKLVSYGGGHSRIEVCDLLTEDGHLVCVKPWGGGSSSLSHLFLQAQVSVQLINNDPAYCTKVSSHVEALDPNFKLTWDYVCDDPSGAEVVLAALRGCPKEALPFFAKLALATCVEELRKMRFRASYAVISPL